LEGLREEDLGQILSVTRNLQKLGWYWYFRAELEE